MSLTDSEMGRSTDFCFWCLGFPVFLVFGLSWLGPFLPEGGRGLSCELMSIGPGKWG